MIKAVTIFLFSILIWNCALGQRIRTAAGSAQFRLEENMSKDELREKLRQQAIINAIENEFGTHIKQESFLDIDQGVSQFKIIGETTILGEWLKTDKEEFSEEIKTIKGAGGKHYELWMRCDIQGKVRQISQPQIDFQLQTATCSDPSCFTENFKSGDPLLVYFKSPADGFLSIFLLEKDQAMRLLPYQMMTSNYGSCVPVAAHQDYWFFDTLKKHNYFDGFSYLLNDELIMETQQDQEFVTLYVVYAREEFVSPGISSGGETYDDGTIVPQSLSISKFKDWLADNRIHDDNFYYRKLTLKIRQ